MKHPTTLKPAKLKQIILALGSLILLIGWFASSATKTALPTQNRPQINNTVVISNTAYQAHKFNLSSVSGYVTNLDSVTHSVELEVLFYGPDNGVLAIATGTVPSLAPGKTRLFYLYTTVEVAGFAYYRVDVTSMR